MDRRFFSEPGKTSMEIRNGMVFIDMVSGKETVQLCTTIAAFRHSTQMAVQILSEFDAKQTRKVAKMSRRRIG